jgi:Holliday junction resolvasome RuvABC ATP-dependent DNA helicase subunit
LARIYGEAVRLPFIEISPKGVKALDDVFDFIDGVLSRAGIGLVDLDEGKHVLPPCVLFFDEVHALSDGIIQGLLKATEFGDAIMQTESGRILDTYAATWMVATTDEGKLFDAFRTRFNPIHLQYLGKKDVAKIVGNNHPDLSEEVCNLVSHYNPRVPRQALQFARYMEMYRKMHNDMSWKEIAKSVANDEGINEYGFNENQMKVLKNLEGGALSKKNLATMIGRKEEELENYIIPTLIAETEDQSSLIKSSARGYILTDEGSRLLVDMRLFDQLAHDPNGPSVNIDPKYVIVEVLNS